PGTALRGTHRLDAALELHGRGPERSAGRRSRGRRPPDRRVRGGWERVQVHHGTRESAARLVHLGESYWQVRLERGLLAAAGDRIVVRSISVPDTLGGGIVLDPQPRRHGPSAAVVARLARIRRGEPAEDPAAPSKPRAAEPRPGASQALSAEALALERRLRTAGAQPPSEAELGGEARHLAALRAAGRAVRVGRSMYAHAEAVEQVGERVREII